MILRKLLSSPTLNTVTDCSIRVSQSKRDQFLETSEEPLICEITSLNKSDPSLFINIKYTLCYGVSHLLQIQHYSTTARIVK